MIDIFNSVPEPIEVWAYGSRVKGTAHEGSDLDLVIRAPTLERLPKGVLMRLRSTIRESNIPILVQVFDWGMLPASFHEQILSANELLFANHSRETEISES